MKRRKYIGCSEGKSERNASESEVPWLYMYSAGTSLSYYHVRRKLYTKNQSESFKMTILPSVVPVFRGQLTHGRDRRTLADAAER